MSQSPSPVGLLYSGGLDSSILLGEWSSAGSLVQPIYVRCGHQWEPAELKAARKFCAQLDSPRILPLVCLDQPTGDLYAQHWSHTGADVPADDSPDCEVYLPGRNLLLVSKAALWCQLHGIRELLLAPLESSPFADASPEYLRQLESLLQIQGPPSTFRVRSPYSKLSKNEVMQRGKRLPLASSFSCLAPVEGRHCGVCNKCAERRDAFDRADLPDDTHYSLQPLNL